VMGVLTHKGDRGGSALAHRPLSADVCPGGPFSTQPSQFFVNLSKGRSHTETKGQSASGHSLVLGPRRHQRPCVRAANCSRNGRPTPPHLPLSSSVPPRIARGVSAGEPPPAATEYGSWFASPPSEGDNSQHFDRGSIVDLALQAVAPPIAAWLAESTPLSESPFVPLHR
jgi:hypothetical protein